MRRHFGAIALAVAISLLACASNAPAADTDLQTKAKPTEADVPKKAKAPPTSPIPFFYINDNRLTYAYLPDGRQTTIIGPVQKQIVAFTHYDAWAYGTNLFNVLLSKSSKNDPASPCPVFGSGCAGESFIRGTVRSTFGFNEIFDTKAFSWGILRNVSFEVGADADVTNAFVGVSTRDLVSGLQFAFSLPYNGFFNVAPLYYQEWNHISIFSPAFMPPGFTGMPDGNVHYRGTWALETNYYMDLGFLPENLQYFAISGRVGFYGPKGTGAYGPYTLPPSTKTATEMVAEPIRLTFDASKLVWGPKYSHHVDLWVSYVVLRNRTGQNDSNPANLACFTAAGTNNGSCSAKSVYSGITVKF